MGVFKKKLLIIICLYAACYGSSVFADKTPALLETSQPAADDMLTPAQIPPFMINPPKVSLVSLPPESAPAPIVAIKPAAVTPPASTSKTPSPLIQIAPIHVVTNPAPALDAH